MNGDDQKLHIGIEGAPMDVGGLIGAVPTTRQLPDRDAPDIAERLGNPETPKDGEGVLVGVVDTGAGANSWLDGGYLAAPGDFEQIPEGKRLFQAGHGTFVTGLILKQAPAAGVWMERALDPMGRGPNDVIDTAAEKLVRRGVHILNLSLGAFEQYEEDLGKLVAKLYDINPDLVIVAAAGNLRSKDDQDAGADQSAKPTEPTKFFPAALPDVLAVGSTRAPIGLAPSNKWTSWSNRGDWIDFAACGERVLSTYISDVQLDNGVFSEDVPGRRFAEWSGTSFSAAVVSGAIAAKMTESGGRSAKQAVEELKKTVFVTAVDGGPGGQVPIVKSRRWDWPPLPESAA